MIVIWHILWQGISTNMDQWVSPLNRFKTLKPGKIPVGHKLPIYIMKENQGNVFLWPPNEPYPFLPSKCPKSNNFVTYQNVPNHTHFIPRKGYGKFHNFDFLLILPLFFCLFFYQWTLVFHPVAITSLFFFFILFFLFLFFLFFFFLIYIPAGHVPVVIQPIRSYLVRRFPITILSASLPPQKIKYIKGTSVNQH